MVFASPIRPLAVISDSCAACALLAASDWEDCALPAAAAAFALSWLATVSDAFAAAAEAAADCTLSSIVPIRSSTPCAARVTSSHAATVSEDWSRVLGSTSASPEYSADSLSGTSTYRTIPPATSSDALHAHWVVEGITSAVASPAVSLTVCAARQTDSIGDRDAPRGHEAHAAIQTAPLGVGQVEMHQCHECSFLVRLPVTLMMMASMLRPR